MIIVSDTSFISNLHKIGKLDLLKSIYGKVIVPEAVNKELLQSKSFDPRLWEVNSYDWIEVRIVKNLNLVESLLNELDQGESEAIVLAKELSAEQLH